MTAGQGEASAQFCLGMLYDTGSKFPEYLDQGVPEDDMAADAWFSVAAASGFDDGPRYRDSILRHCNMWNPPCRASPEPAPPEQLELEYVPFDDFAEAL